ncbi:zinc-binding dehydrogenase, partial [Mycobacterium tuberculosis]|nr:zinc-binding dehydrogenase [Mycobacterium tuberculosis]
QGERLPADALLVAGEALTVDESVLTGEAVPVTKLAVDIAADKLDLARSIGAVAAIDARETPDVVAAIRDITGGGAHVSIDALGSPTTCFHSIANLRRRGRHVQVGLM